MQSEPVNLAGALAQIQDYWDPHIVGELNGQHVKLARIKGEFIWHHHENEDELFEKYKDVVEVLDICKSAGALHLAMITSKLQAGVMQSDDAAQPAEAAPAPAAPA